MGAGEVCFEQNGAVHTHNRASAVVVRTESAKEYTAGKRLYGLVEGHLLWAYDMAAMGQPLQPHLSATLKRA